MYVEIEPSGCVERKGLVRVRFAMYLDEGDYGYDVHHVQIPVIPQGGYTGAVDTDGDPIDWNAYNTWRDSLPKVWQNNPFHNHFIYAKPETSDKEIMDVGQAFLNEAYIKWASNEKLDLKNPKIKFPTSFDEAEINTKVQHLKTVKLERRI